MAVLTYKCPNCDGGLVFDPENQNFHCPYCYSNFVVTDEEFKKKNAVTEAEHAAEVPLETVEQKQEPDEVIENLPPVETVSYHCPSCGAEVVTDATTAATQCFYCKNPVVLESRLEGDFTPDAVIPFTIEEAEAKKKFFEWGKTKKYAPNYFFAPEMIESVTGVYFPYWSVDAEVEADLSASATQVRTWTRSNVRYTETKYYNIARGGNIKFNNIVKNALNKADNKLAENVQPYTMSGLKPFQSGYLAGFQAEKRDIEQLELEDDIANDLREYSAAVLKDKISGYTTVRTTGCNVTPKSSKWKYTLLPVWTVTHRGNDGKIYYYAMNGQTGKTCGIVPIDKGKLTGLFFRTAAIAFVIAMVIGGFIIW